MTIGQMTGEIIRSQHGHHPMRVMGQPRGAKIGGCRAGARPFGLRADGNGDLGGHAGDLGAGFPCGFAGFAGDERGERFGLGAQSFGKGLGQRDAVGQGACAPQWQRGAGGIDGGRDGGGIGDRAIPHDLAGGRAGGYQTVGGGGGLARHGGFLMRILQP